MPNRAPAKQAKLFILVGSETKMEGPATLHCRELELRQFLSSNSWSKETMGEPQ